MRGDTISRHTQVDIQMQRLKRQQNDTRGFMSDTVKYVISLEKLSIKQKQTK